ncbi:MAG: hypothetical protein MZV70_48455 [Desulfobacterales bacterium]|nr:hypothetical protein [Desulfobacterales bacterium]
MLATNIAETSLTIEGIRVVVDGGLARVPRFDVRSGMTRLATQRGVAGPPPTSAAAGPAGPGRGCATGSGTRRSATGLRPFDTAGDPAGRPGRRWCWSCAIWGVDDPGRLRLARPAAGGRLPAGGASCSADLGGARRRAAR